MHRLHEFLWMWEHVSFLSFWYLSTLTPSVTSQHCFFIFFFCFVFHFILPSFPSMFSPFAFPNRDFPHPVPLLLSHLNLFPPYLLLWSEIIFTALNTALHFLLPFPHLPVLFLSTFLKYTIIERNWSFPKWYSKTKDAEA